MVNKKGFTLIELLLVLVLIGIALSIIFSPIVFSFKSFDTQNEKANVISDARTIMDYLTREIRKADMDKVEVVDGSLVIDLKKYGLKDGILYKDDKKVIEGIDNIIMEKHSEKITIEIIIEAYKLSSDVNLR